MSELGPCIEPASLTAPHLGTKEKGDERVDLTLPLAMTERKYDTFASSFTCLRTSVSLSRAIGGSIIGDAMH